jgi:hypothetical protein
LAGTVMTRHSYIVDMRCPKCGRVHRVASYFQLDSGPTEPGSLVDLYGDGELPPTLASLLNDLVWCPTVEKWMRQNDRRRVFLMPRRVEAGR